MKTKAQKDAQVKYKTKLDRVYIDLSPAESDIKEHLDGLPEPRATYIKRLIREDIERKK
jgi:hypothetical protein